MTRTPTAPGTKLLPGLLLVSSLWATAWAQTTPPAAPEIYSCVDAKGRRLTSDRPIAECIDREQKMLNPSGTVKAKLGPSLTAHERGDIEAREKVALEEQARLMEERRRDRALLTRYPNKKAHDQERALAIEQIVVVKQAALNRVRELEIQRRAVMNEMEFYKKDPTRAPPLVRRQVDEVAQSLSVQARFIAEQDGEIKRVNSRFDEEIVRLKQLWAVQPGPGTPDTPNKR